MSKSTYDHTHIYKANASGKIYRCTIDGCPHHLNKELLEGRTAQCPYCGTSYSITRVMLKRKVLHCGNCTNHGKPVKDKESGMFADLLETKEIDPIGN